MWRRTQIALIAALTLGVYIGPASASDTVTGFGATADAWNATHTMDRRHNVELGCCYDPVGNRPVYDDRYSQVELIGGRVLSYYEWLGPHVSMAAAKRAALGELPPDAHIRSFTVHGRSCAILILSSRQLRKVLGRQGGQVVVEFGSGEISASTYTPQKVTNLLFTSMIIAGPTAQNC